MLVAPVLYYVCEIWDLSNISRGNVMMEGVAKKVEKVHMSFLQECPGMR